MNTDERKLAADRVRKENLWKRYESGKPLTDEQLKEIGIADADSLPARVKGMAGLARIIQRALKIRCGREDVRHWQTWATPIPPPGDSNLYEVASALDWVRKYVIPKRASSDDQDGGLFEKSTTWRLRGEIAAEEHKSWQREVERGAWVKKSDHARALAGAARIVQTLFDREVEVDGPRAGADILRNLGASPELIVEYQRQMVAHGSAFLDRRRREFAKRIQTNSA